MRYLVVESNLYSNKLICSLFCLNTIHIALWTKNRDKTSLIYYIWEYAKQKIRIQHFLTQYPLLKRTSLNLFNFSSTVKSYKGEATKWKQLYIGNIFKQSIGALNMTTTFHIVLMYPASINFRYLTISVKYKYKYIGDCLLSNLPWCRHQRRAS